MRQRCSSKTTYKAQQFCHGLEEVSVDGADDEVHWQNSFGVAEALRQRDAFLGDSHEINEAHTLGFDYLFGNGSEMTVQFWLLYYSFHCFLHKGGSFIGFGWDRWIYFQTHSNA